MKYALGDLEVDAHERSWIAPNAIVIGRVTIEEDASIWWSCVLRGDGEPIRVGRGSNIQDGTIVHTDPGFPAVIGADVTIGHGVMIHGCEIGAGSMIGIGAVILTGAKIGRNCLIGAHALIPEGKIIPDNSKVLGIPGKVMGEVRDDQAERMRRSSAHYVRNWQRYAADLREQD